MIKEFTSAELLNSFILEEKKKGKQIGFVPTMGALHEGHLSLIKQSLKNNDWTVCSIFVNPKQFNSLEDLEKYPRTEKSDIKLLEKYHCQIVFIPTVDEIYPPESNKNISFNFGALEEEMEGKHRPGHFNGMAIVVKRLFDIVSPTNAYFGKKDFQQLMIVKKLVEMEKLAINIVGCEIKREENGLAMSSRNKLLTDQERADAAIINQQLQYVAKNYHADQVEELIEYAIKTINSLPSLQVEYLEIMDARDLSRNKVSKKDFQPHIFTAVRVGNIRLIDNLPINV